MAIRRRAVATRGALEPVVAQHVLACRIEETATRATPGVGGHFERDRAAAGSLVRLRPELNRHRRTSRWTELERIRREIAKPPGLVTVARRPEAHRLQVLQELVLATAIE